MISKSGEEGNQGEKKGEEAEEEKTKPRLLSSSNSRGLKTGKEVLWETWKVRGRLRICFSVLRAQVSGLFLNLPPSFSEHTHPKLSLIRLHSQVA